MEKFLRWLFEPDKGILLQLFLISIAAFVLSFLVRHKTYFYIIPNILSMYVSWRVVVWFVQRFRRAHPTAVFIYGLIPVQLAAPLAITLLLAYNWGRWITPYTIEKNPAATIVLKDEKTAIQGKGFLELNRFIIFVAPGGKITAVAITNINSIQFPKPGPANPKDHQGNH